MFTQWWNNNGFGIACDIETNGVKGIEDLRRMAEAAFEAGSAQALNYTADDEVHPTVFTFSEGTIVRAKTSRHTGTKITAELTLERGQ